VKKVLITGASGFIGKALVDGWSASKARVKACVRRPPPDGPGSLRVEFLCLPHIDRYTDWRDHLEDVNWVVHLAGRAHLRHSDARGGAREHEEINYKATAALMRACQQAGIERFVYLSSVKVHGEGRQGAYREDDPLDPQDAYAHSKRNAEAAIQKIAVDGDTEWVILRPPLVYGPGVKANFLALLKLVDLHLPLPLAALGNRRSMIYLGNLVDAIMFAAESSEAADQIFLLSDDCDLTMADLMREIARAMEQSPMLFPFPTQGLEWCGRILGRGEAIQKLTRPLTVDISKIKNQLGWHPPVRVRDGITATVDWFQNEVL
jgi:nucleoside-diphosphate-sugar epimerase